jgi:hypothetical protein
MQIPIALGVDRLDVVVGGKPLAERARGQS